MVNLMIIDEIPSVQNSKNRYLPKRVNQQSNRKRALIDHQTKLIKFYKFQNKLPTIAKLLEINLTKKKNNFRSRDLK